HIFEERYKLMITRCLEEKRAFGVLLIRTGSEVDGAAVPHEVGTTAEIAGAKQLDDGRLKIVAVGGERFRLQALKTDQPYLVGDAEAWPIGGSSTERAQQQVEPVRNLFRHYLDLVDRTGGNITEIEEIPDEPRALALLVAITMRVPAPQKLHLLVQHTVGEVLSAERKLLHREQLILEQIDRTQGEQWEGGYSGFLARN
ncbi:LON peptidase substrate-binding domain-containing protein, partial [Chloroflexota bacterium]